MSLSYGPSKADKQALLIISISKLSFRQIISPENIPYEINKTSWPVITEIKAQHL